MNQDVSKIKLQNEIPEILAPAGNEAAFLAALAAGADAVYCGLKAFSARMRAENFGFSEMIRLARLAHDKGSKIYVTLNTLVKPGELSDMANIIHKLKNQVKPDGLIVMDPAALMISRRIGFLGEIHFSTLANVSSPSALIPVRKVWGADRVVLPRELHIDEIKSMADSCPAGLGLEVFVHGALCYAVSGRCYWSSYLGGKSGLRGMCVQPCRRQYHYGSCKDRYFSCVDLSLDVLAKVLLDIPQIRAWKIEGRKKGPHYVYYTTKAYRIMRDEAANPNRKKEALELLSYSLGRTGSHFYFLPQRPQSPLKNDGHTGSGLFIGNVKGGGRNFFFAPREPLFAGDLLRIGYEDDPGHSLQRMNKSVPKKGRLVLKLGKGRRGLKGAPVFLIDRLEPKVNEELVELRKKLSSFTSIDLDEKSFSFKEPKSLPVKGSDREAWVFRKMPKRLPSGRIGFWLDFDSPKNIRKKTIETCWWWLPPVIWPGEELLLREFLEDLLKKGGKNFVLNAPWQTALFLHPKRLNLWAGPFCNISNPLSIEAIKEAGFKGAVVSPEIGGNDMLALPKKSPLPLGIVLRGAWPLCISRIFSENLEIGKTIISPRGEKSWAQKYGSTYWIYPNWKLDLSSSKKDLIRAGYSLFFHISEPVPKGVRLKKRPGLWNRDIGLQ